MRLVLDTNIWLDWLVFNDPGISPVRTMAEAGKAEIIITGDCAQELERVLGYAFGRKILDAAEQAACLARFHAAACMFVPDGEPGFESPAFALPACKDPDDQKFLELARDCRADFLVTRDRDLLVFARRKYQYLPFRIVTPQQFASVYPGT